MKVTQSCQTLCDPMDYTVHRILQARILEWVAFPFSRGSSLPRDQTQVSHIADGFFTSWATRETLFPKTHHFSHLLFIYPWRIDVWFCPERTNGEKINRKGKIILHYLATKVIVKLCSFGITDSPFFFFLFFIICIKFSLPMLCSPIFRIPLYLQHPFLILSNLIRFQETVHSYTHTHTHTYTHIHNGTVLSNELHLSGLNSPEIHG